jgi:hypothetical protein
MNEALIERGPTAPSDLSPAAFRARALLIVGVAALAVVAVLFFPPIAQSADYHGFADQRAFFGVPNFLNVASNAAFAFVGASGLAVLLARRRPGEAPLIADPTERRAYLVFFAAVAFVAIGSGYYHLAPDTRRLFWDRLPMSVAFMSLFAVTISAWMSRRAGRAFFLPLLFIGAASTLYWHLTEIAGHGDVRLYALVQFYPMLAVPLILALFPAPPYGGARYFVMVMALYAVAKALEILDARIFALGGVVSGHTLKHLVAAAAVYSLVRMLVARRSLAAAPPPAP